MAAPKKKTRTLFHFFRNQNDDSEKNDDQFVDIIENTRHTDEQTVTISASSTDADGSTSGQTPSKISQVDKKRKYCFIQEWVKDRPWLDTNDSGGMVCKWCIQTGKTNSFASRGGNTNFRTSTLDRHVEITDHQEVMEDLKLRSNFKVLSSNAFAKRSESMLRTFETVYWLAKENCASLKFLPLLDFLDYQGIDVSSMKVGENATYTSRISVEEYQECIADVIEAELMEKVKQSPYLSILTDESTDISNSKKLVVYGRIIDPTTVIPSTHFLGNVTIATPTCTAEIIFNKITTFLHEKGISLAKIVGFGSDGAAVMTGSKSGVATRLREKAPHLINIHCMAHRFNLCTSQASRNIPYIKDTFEKTFKDIFYYFEKSANRAAELQRIQKVLESPTLKVREVHEIRWLAFYDALYAVFHSWKALVTYFKNSKNKQSEDILAKITDYRFVAFLHIMMDIIPHLAQFSIMLQKSDVDIASVGPALDGIYTTLKRVDSGGTHYQAEMKEKLVSSTDTGKEKLKFHGIELNFHRSTVRKATDDITAARKDFITALQSQMRQRFPKECREVAEAFDVFGLRNLTFLSEEELEEHGNEKIRLLSNHFGMEKKSKNDETLSPPFFDCDKVPAEWKLAKTVIKREMYPRDRMLELWKLVYQHHVETFPNLLKLVALSLVMPFHTADCERGFSQQNIIKTPSRNRLEGDTLNRLMIMNIEGPPLRQFDLRKALDKWKSKKDRRLFRK